jgi:hypothetical protein
VIPISWSALPLIAASSRLPRDRRRHTPIKANPPTTRRIMPIIVRCIVLKVFVLRLLFLQCQQTTPACFGEHRSMMRRPPGLNDWRQWGSAKCQVMGVKRTRWAGPVAMILPLASRIPFSLARFFGLSATLIGPRGMPSSASPNRRSRRMGCSPSLRRATRASSLIRRSTRMSPLLFQPVRRRGAVSATRFLT